MKAFITLLSSEDYLSAVLVLNAALKRAKSKYKLVCAVDNKIISDNIKQVLAENDIICEIVPHLDYPATFKQKYNSERLNNTATKLQIFLLTNYEKLIYIDADVLLLYNIDDLFDKPSGAIVIMPDLPKIGFSGLFVFKPTLYNIDDIYNMLNAGFGLDGDIIAALFNNITNKNYIIDYSYLCPLHRFYTLSLQEQKQIKVIHFCNESQKPWSTNFKNSSTELDLYAKLIKKFSYFNK